MKIKFAFLLLALVLACFWLLSQSTSILSQEIITYSPAPLAAEFTDKALFLSPIKQVRNAPSAETVTGLTVPHHLLARDLMAKAFNFASGGKYSQILLLSPDHFNLGETDISTTRRSFLTVFGELQTDANAVADLEKLPFIREQDFFYREHGLQAELPFIKYYFPGAKIIALTFKVTTPQAELDQTIEELKKILNPGTLVVQSTDFSHYLTADQAKVRDEQTIKILEQADTQGLFSLNQPANLDSIATQYVQMRLQNEFFNSKFYLLDHKNSQDYTKEKVESTTSYIVQAYFKTPGTADSDN
jgi:AmmeMemoRadiSam system protein B